MAQLFRRLFDLNGKIALARSCHDLNLSGLSIFPP